MITCISDFAAEDVEAGTGLAIEYQQGSYVFYLAGTRHRCPPGEIFYAGVGGHREAGESWPACVHRESLEEIGVDITLLPSAATYYVPHDREVQPVEISDQPRPLALYEMIHPAGTPREGGLYRIVIYRARLNDLPASLAVEEVRALIALTEDQVRRGAERKPTIRELLQEGAMILAGQDQIVLENRLYPMGTAAALSRILCVIPPAQ